MIWEWKSNFDFSDESRDKDPDCPIGEILSKVSINEIQNIQSRINFYLTHFMILARRTNSESSDAKINYLKKLSSIFDDEIQKRQNKIYL